MLTYDVLICTLNRPETLRTCLSLIERQTERPQRVIVVDASDDHDAARETVMRDRDPGIEWLFLKSPVRNLPAQRNFGLGHVTAPVVLMPDDDSMLYPQAASEMMAAYRADLEGRVAAVSGKAAAHHPLGSDQIERSRAIKDRIEPIRHKLEQRLVPKPFVSYARSRWNDFPAWIDGKRFKPVETVGGFLLSLRSDVIKQHRFDETMGSAIGYALHEDMELSVRLQKAGYLLVAAERAAIFHDVHPGARAKGFAYGFYWIANYAYACRKNAIGLEDQLTRFLRYKRNLYYLRSKVKRTAYNRDVYVGARTACSFLNDIRGTASNYEWLRTTFTPPARP